ncbi:methyl-accepting chemotaxis sensory transducer with Cache sensor [Bradyrhizobium canariense]|uniref:Methyl-accepting chemotaxis sensory transducer with Cache sensor n=2 Tax=Bradyrhizobium canariense TaxID=255045 RepID=A0A1H1UQ03_9BRAD|nr:methyl-accepting chemotaxis sensory transducer with Cache sensor [Bradyrhizobium canariense]
MLGNLRISSKLLIMVGLSVLGIAMVAFVGLSNLRSNLLEDRKAKLHDVVLLARQAVDLDYQASKKAGLSDAEALEKGKALLRTLRFGKDDYFYAFNAQGLVQAHPSPNVENKNLYNAPDSDGVFFTRQQIELAAQGGGFVAYRFPRAGGTEPLPKISYATEFKPYGWTIGGGIYLDDIDAIFWQQVWSIGTLVGVALLLVVGMSLLLGRSIVGPITGMTAAMRKIAAGETATVIPAQERRDEVGAMAQSVQVFKDNMIEAVRLRGEQDELKKKAETEKHGLLGKMADDFEHSVRGSLDALAGAAVELRTTSNSMSTTAGEASQQATTVAAVAEQASANVQTVAAATEELSSSVSEIGRQVAQSTRIAGQAVEEANRTNLTVQGLSAAAQKIGDVVKLINDIASQTNLLALNATIEAARAGEAGKGFAVVASEVKSLASQTAKATEDISAQVAAMQGATTDAVQAIENIGGTIGAINEITTAIASAVEEQGSATKEIARNVQEAAQGTSMVSGNIGSVTRAAGETGTAAGRVLASAEELNEQAAMLRSKVDGFLVNIRAA